AAPARLSSAAISPAELPTPTTRILRPLASAAFLYSMLWRTRPPKRSRPGNDGVCGFDAIPVATTTARALTDSPARVRTAQPRFARVTSTTSAPVRIGSENVVAYR